MNNGTVGLSWNLDFGHMIAILPPLGPEDLDPKTGAAEKARRICRGSCWRQGLSERDQLGHGCSQVSAARGHKQLI